MRWAGKCKSSNNCVNGKADKQQKLAGVDFTSLDQFHRTKVFLQTASARQ